MRISDWSSDVCSSDLGQSFLVAGDGGLHLLDALGDQVEIALVLVAELGRGAFLRRGHGRLLLLPWRVLRLALGDPVGIAADDHVDCAGTVKAQRHGDGPVEEIAVRSEEHTSELKSLMRIS